MLGACAINNVLLMGRLTADPELKQAQSGISTCQVTVAVTRGFANQNGERETDFITIVAWRQTAEFICRYFSKGRLILVEGELRTRTYDDKRYPDVKHYVTEVYANNVSFGESKGSGAQPSGYSDNQHSNYATQPAQQQSAPAPNVSVNDLNDFEEVISDSDLPF